MNISERFERAIAQIDEANSQDPRRVEHGGRTWPAEVLYSQRMTSWLERLEPMASEALRLAARAQHIQRWRIPRESYPMDRAGYHRWRTELGRFHAATTAEVLGRIGYDESTIERVCSLLKKDNLKSDPEMQTLEDVICLVFLENYLDEFAEGKDDEKLKVILAKTWRKMSERGRTAATASIGLSDRIKGLLC